MGVDTRLLPWLELDPSLVLLARPVLREQAWQMRGVDGEDHRRATVRAHLLNPVAGERRVEEPADPIGDDRVPGVERDAEVVRAPLARDAAVAEIEAERALAPSAT